MNLSLSSLFRMTSDQQASQELEVLMNTDYMKNTDETYEARLKKAEATRTKIGETLSLSSLFRMASDQQASQELEVLTNTDYMKKIDETYEARLKKAEATHTKIIDALFETIGRYYSFYLINKLNTVAQKVLADKKENEDEKELVRIFEQLSEKEIAEKELTKAMQSQLKHLTELCHQSLEEFKVYPNKIARGVSIKEIFAQFNLRSPLIIYPIKICMNIAVGLIDPPDNIDQMDSKQILDFLAQLGPNPAIKRLVKEHREIKEKIETISKCVLTPEQIKIIDKFSGHEAFEMICKARLL